MGRTNRNVTLSELTQALVASGGSRLIAANDLGVSLAWVYQMIGVFEEQGATFPDSPPKRKTEREIAKVYKPTRKEIRAAWKAFQEGWTKSEKRSRRVSKLEDLTVPVVEAPGEPREETW